MVWIAILGLVVPMMQTPTDSATEQDLLALESMLKNAEFALAEAEVSGQPIPDALRQQVEALREEGIYLRVKMKKHRASGGRGTGLTALEVSDLARSIRSIRAELRQIEGSRHHDRVTIEAGTQLTVRLLDTLTTRDSSPGDRFEAAVVDPLPRLGEIAVPSGAIVEGTVETADRASGRTDRTSRLVLAFDRLTVADQAYDLDASIIGAGSLETGVSDEKAKIGVGAGIGSILGAVFGGKKGAVVGAVLGGAGAILATEGKNVELPYGTVLTLRLERALDVDAHPDLDTSS